MNKKRIGIITLTVFLCVQFALISTAIAAETPTPTITTNDDGTLTVEHTHATTDEEPKVLDSITQNGQVYTLEGAVTTNDPSYERPSQHFTRQAFNQVPAEGAGNWAAYFPATYPIDEGEFKGEIGFDHMNPFSVVERYHSYLVQVDKHTVITDLPDNDVSRLPFTMDFEVVCDATPGATMIRTLRILDVSYEISGRDHLGLPNSFTAYVTYRGQEGLHELAYYEVIAYYSGSIDSIVDQMSTTATYTPVVTVIAPPPAERTVISTPEVPLAEPAPSLFPLIITAATIVVLLALPLLYFLVLSNARLVRVIEPREKNGSKEENKLKGSKEEATTELICRRRLVLRQGIAEFRIPPDVDIFDGGLYCLIIKPYFASRDGDVQMTWQGKIMAAMPLARHIDVNFKEMLITSTEAAIMEAGLLD